MAVCFSTGAAERVFDFSQLPLGETPTGFTSTVTGEGGPGNWKIIEAEVPSLMAPLSPNAPSGSKRRVLAQLSTNAADERFPLLIYNDEVYGDFTLNMRFNCADGKAEQMAGIAFRIQDEKNYYIVRASAKGNTFRFYKFVNGMRSAPIGPEIQIPSGVWHEMTVECKGNQIRCLLNGKEAIPALTDNSFTHGKIGFWTKSDSVSYFTEARIVYKPREPLAQVAVREMMQRYPKLIGLKIHAFDSENKIRLIASSDESETGKEGSDVEENVIRKEMFYYVKGAQNVSVIMPLRDRNGEAVAALRVILKAFPGQTEKNAVARAMPINQQITKRLRAAKDLYE